MFNESFKKNLFLFIALGFMVFAIGLNFVELPKSLPSFLQFLSPSKQADTDTDPNTIDNRPRKKDPLYQDLNSNQLQPFIEPILIVGQHEDGVEIALRGSTNDIYEEDEMYKMDLQLVNKQNQVLTVYLTIIDNERLPYAVVVENNIDRKQSSSKNLTEIEKLIADKKFIEVGCFIYKPEVFAEKCSHSKCVKWQPYIQQFYDSITSYLEDGTAFSEIGFATKIIEYQ